MAEEIELSQPNDIVAHFYSFGIDDDDNIELIKISDHMTVCNELVILHFPDTTGDELYVTFDGDNPNTSDRVVMQGDRLKLENIAFSGSVRVRGGSDSQRASIICWGHN